MPDRPDRIPDAVVGDEVVIIGRQGDLEITPAEVASRHGLGLHNVARPSGPASPASTSPPDVGSLDGYCLTAPNVSPVTMCR